MDRTGFRGAFSTLMAEHPDIAKHLIDQNQDRRLRCPLTHIHKVMLNALRKKGVDCLDYPFNTQSRGYQALSNYLKNSNNHMTMYGMSQDDTPVVPFDRGTRHERMVLFDRNRNWPPAVYFESLRYIGQGLPEENVKVVVVVNEDDIRVISAYRIDGSFLDNLTSPTLSRLESPYSLQKHRQRVRVMSRQKRGHASDDCS
jgi:hypothetical protein